MKKINLYLQDGFLCKFHFLQSEGTRYMLRLFSIGRRTVAQEERHITKLHLISNNRNDSWNTYFTQIRYKLCTEHYQKHNIYCPRKRRQYCFRL